MSEPTKVRTLIESKLCTKCGDIKTVNDFTRNRSRKDGLNGWCKSCMKVISAAIRLRPSYLQKQRAAAKRWRSLPINMEKHRLQARQQRIENPLEVVARRRVRDAISSGELVRQPCEKCGSGKTHAHHTDYSKPLDVTWLCPSHHTKEHQAA